MDRDKTKRNIALIIIVFIAILLLTANYLGIKEKNVWINEQSDMRLATEKIFNGEYAKAKQLLDTHKNNIRIMYSVDFNSSYAVVLRGLGKDEETIKYYISRAYNSFPIFLIDHVFLNEFCEYLESCEGINNESQ